MLGFKLEACSSEGFAYNIRRWTEGSLWLLKVAIQGSGNKPTIGANKALINSIEGEFEKMKEIKLDEVVAANMNFELCVLGDFNFKYTFRADRSSELKRYELARKIAQCPNDMLDQVALALFEAISSYQTHYVIKDLESKYSYNFLNVSIYT